MATANGDSNEGNSVTSTTSPSAVSLLATAASRFGRRSSSRHDGAPPASSNSAGKYRVLSTPTATGTGASSTSDPMPSSSQATGSRDTTAASSMKRQASERGASTNKSPVKFADLVRQTSGLHQIDGEVGTSVDPSTSGNRSPTQRISSKLPQKMRASVTIMRSQLAMLGSAMANNTSNNSSATSPDTKSRSRQSSVIAHTAVSPTATAQSTRARYSRQSHELSSKQADREQGRRASSIAAATAAVTVAMRRSMQPQRSQHSLTTDAASVLQFMELLRPLQSSLTSLRDAKNGDSQPSDSDSESESDDDPDDALFRQHERESSRILRICCSLDNLLFAIADQVQENKHDVIAIASGPARKLVELILGGITQIADAMAATQVQDGLPSLTAKDERYLREFLVEIADRWSHLDELLRKIYISSLQRVQRELVELQSAHGELRQQKQTLELEILELREFHSSENAATMAMTSNFMRLTDQRQSINIKGPETEQQQPSDETLAAYELKDRRDESTDGDEDSGTQTTAKEEIKRLKAQCSEYGRLLEMAKQEIRLSHQERQSQHARLVELSQSLLRDQEIAQLRNELQSEKKRVKLLEMEGLRMRESHVDLNLKIQSLQLNHSASTGPVKTTAGRGPTTATAATPPTRSRAGSSCEMRIEEVQAATQAHASSEVTATSGKAIEIATVPGDSVLPVCTSSSSTVLLQVTSEIPSSMPWLVRVLEPPERPSKPPSDEKEKEKDDDGMVRLFLSNLLMTERELDAATAQAKLRKKSNVPTLGAPPGFAKSAATSPTKKKKSKQSTGPPDPKSVPISVDEWISDALVVASVRQLMWVLYEQYLMCEETRYILNPQRRVKWQRDAASSAGTPPSLASFVLHYFLERHTSEDDALRKLRRFVSVLAKLRVEYGDVRLFCEFLDGSRSREELHFTLWVLQAVDAVDLGVNYDTNSHSAASQGTRLGRYVCTLKALYVTRMVYRLLHVKSLKKPSPVSPTKANGAKKTPTASATAVAAPAALPVVTMAASSPKKRRKSRPASAGAVSAATSQPSSSIVPSSVAETSEIPVYQSIVDRAIAEYANAVHANSGYPLTLEMFNEVVLRFAVAPSREELRAQLGPFYQATGDERKVSLDVFLVLVAEVFATQLHWRHAQLQALYVRLAKEDEIEQLLAAKRLQEELNAAAALAAASTSKKSRADVKEKPKKQEKKSKKRERRVGIDKSADRHLKGLSRERLRKFLVQGGLVQDEFQSRDYDALYVAILEVTTTTPSEIHFEQVYDALRQLEMLGNDAFAVDFSSWLADDAVGNSTEDTRAPEAARQNQQVVDTWRMLAVQTLTVTENDPNMFTRHVARQLSGRVHAALTKYTTSPLSIKSEMEIVHSIRECLRFTWSLASRRMSGGLRGNQHAWRPFDSCLTEFMYMNQAVKMALTAAGDVDLATVPLLGPVEEQDPLTVFYDCRFVNVARLQQCTATLQEPLAWKPELQRVLQRYALHLAHLFDSYSAARFTGSGGITKNQWLALARDVGLLSDTCFSIPVLEDLFVESATSPNGQDGTTKNISRFEVVVDKPQFTALLVHTAVLRYQITSGQRKRLQHKTQTKRSQRRQEALPTVAQIVDQFCHQVVVPHAFYHRNRMQEEDFHRKLSCPLVAKILLEHRAFLRQLFSHFAKCGDHDDDDGKESREPHHVAAMRDADAFESPQRRKTTRNSMGIAQFLSFLRRFGLLEMRSSLLTSTTHYDNVLQLDENGAALVFRAVMAIESDDVTRMEFDEFAAAVAAIAALRKPHPFVALHAKVDAFVGELRAIHGQSRVAAGSVDDRFARY